MKIARNIKLTEKEKVFIDKCLNSETMMSEDDTFSKTADFGNGIEMDIKLCGAREEKPWTEAVLFCNGSEVCHSDVCEEFEGEWELEYNGNIYVVNVR